MFQANTPKVSIYALFTDFVENIAFFLFFVLVRYILILHLILSYVIDKIFFSPSLFCQFNRLCEIFATQEGFRGICDLALCALDLTQWKCISILYCAVYIPLYIPTLCYYVSLSFLCYTVSIQRNSHLFLRKKKIHCSRGSSRSRSILPATSDREKSTQERSMTIEISRYTKDKVKNKEN